MNRPRMWTLSVRSVGVLLLLAAQPFAGQFFAGLAPGRPTVGTAWGQDKAEPATPEENAEASSFDSARWEALSSRLAGDDLSAQATAWEQLESWLNAVGGRIVDGETPASDPAVDSAIPAESARLAHEERRQLTQAMAELATRVDETALAIRLLEAVGRVGTADVVPMLTSIWAGSSEGVRDLRRQDAARAALVRIPGAAAGFVCLHRMNTATTRADLLGALETLTPKLEAGHSPTIHDDARSAFQELLSEPPDFADKATREAARIAWTAIARAQDVPQLWGLRTEDPASSAEVAAVVRAIARIARVTPDALAELLPILFEIAPSPAANRELARIAIGVDPSGAYARIRRAWLNPDESWRDAWRLLVELPESHHSFVVTDAMAAKDVRVRKEALRAFLIRGSRYRRMGRGVREAELHDPTRAGSVRQLALACLNGPGDDAEGGSAEGDSATDGDAPEQPSDPELNALALEVLGTYATAAHVRVIAQWAGRRGPERKTAQSILSALSFRGSSQALLEAARDSSLDEGIRAATIRALGDREYEPAAMAFADWISSGSGQIRNAAVRALGPIAGLPHLDRLMACHQSETDARIRVQIRDVMIGICVHNLSEERRADPFATYYDNTPPDNQPARVSLLEGLQRVGGTRALGTVQRALSDNAPEIRNAAFRALTRWSTGDALPPLRTVILANLAGDGANTPEAMKRRVLAVRAYLRLLGQPGGGRGESIVSRIREVEAAFDTDLRRRALTAVSSLARADALVYAESQLRIPGVRAEAEIAVLQIASRVYPLEPERAEAALLSLTEAEASTDLTRQRVEQWLATARQYRGYVGAWRFAGPYRSNGKSAVDLLRMEWPPERGQAVRWAAFGNQKGDSPWIQNLESLNSDPNQVVYLECEVYSEVSRDAIARAGSDDGLKVWVHRQLVHENNVTRGFTAGQDEFKIRLEEGWNPVRVKVSQGGGGWMFSLQLLDADGTPWREVRLRRGDGADER